MAAIHEGMTESAAREKAIAAGKDPDWYVVELRNHDLLIDETPALEIAVTGQGGEAPARMEAVPALARPLYDLETHLAALVDTEDVVPTELEQDYALELHATLVATVEKRDRVGQFLNHMKSQIAFAHAESVRLHEREQFFQRALDRMEGYVTRVIDMLGLDPKGKRKKLEGNVCTLALHGCDKRAEVLNEEAVPAQYKRVTVTLPALTWELICDSLDLDLRDQVLGEVKSPKVEVSTSLAKADLKAGLEIPGMRLAGGTYVEVK